MLCLIDSGLACDPPAVLTAIQQDTLQGFQGAIHELFPKIIDTKYLATHAEGDLNASPTLEQIAKSLRRQPLPKVVTHEDYSKYNDREAFHEAGYDSLLTATIMLRLAAKLGAERGVETSVPQNDFEVDMPTSMVPTERAQQPDTYTQSASESTRKSKSKTRNAKVKTNVVAHHQLRTRNLFSALGDLNLDAESEPEPDDTVEKRPMKMGWCGTGWDDEPVEAEAEKAAAPGSWADDPFEQDKTGWVPIEQVVRQPMELIPAFDSPFWHEFGNKLRVFGTEEAVLHLADW